MTPKFEVGEKVVIDGLYLQYGVIEKETKNYYIVNGTKFRKIDRIAPTSNPWDRIVTLKKLTPELEEEISKINLADKTIKLFGDFQKYKKTTSQDWQEVNALLKRLIK